MSNDKIRARLYIDGNFAFHIFNYLIKTLNVEINWIKLIDFIKEGIDFSYGHKQDHRNWSENFNPNSGRLQVTDKDRKSLVIAEPSYDRTFDFIDLMVNGKKDETQYNIRHVVLRKRIANYP